MMTQEEEDEMNRILQELHDKIKKQHFDKNLPITYLTKDGLVVQEFKDGTKKVIHEIGDWKVPVEKPRIRI